MNRAKFLSTAKLDVLLLFVVALIAGRGLMGGGWPLGHDTLTQAVWYANFASQLNRYGGVFLFSPCSYWFCGFVPSLTYGMTVEIPLFGFLTLLFNGDYFLVLKLEMFLIFFISGLGMYLFSKIFSGKRLVCFISTLAYMLNQYFFIELPYEGHLPVAWGIALAPLVFVFLERAIRSSMFLDSVLFGVFLAFFVGVVWPSYVLLLIVWIFFYLLCHCLFFSKRGFRVQKTLRVLKVSTISVSVAFLVSFYWLLPLIFSGIRPFYFAIEDFKVYSPDLLHALTINVNSDCSPNFLTPSLGPWGAYLGLLVPILAFCGWLFRRNGVNLFFLVSAFVSVYFAKGANPPFEEPFVWAYLNVPFFASVREGVRYLLVTALSYSFLIGVATDELYGVCLNSSRLREVFGGWFNWLWVKKIRGNRYLGSIVVCLIVFFILFYSFIPIAEGFGTFTLPNGYISSYRWLGERGGSGSRVFGYPIDSWASYDFIAPRSIIAPSSFIPVTLGEQAFWGGTPLAASGCVTDFAGYLKYLVENNGTDSFGKILSFANVRFIVLDLKVASEAAVNFFSCQEDFHEVFRNDECIVFENDRFDPMFSAYSSSALVIGGRGVFPTIYTFGGDNVSNWAWFFVEQLRDTEEVRNLDRFRSVVFSHPDFQDFIFTTYASESTVWVGAYGFRSRDANENWISSDWWKYAGKVVSEDTLTTCGNKKVDIPFTVINNGQYDVWVRVSYAAGRGVLTVLVDDMGQFNLKPSALFPAGFRWVKGISVYLNAGSHKITFVSDGEGFNDINRIAVITPEAYEKALEEAVDFFRKSSVRLIYALEAEDVFCLDLQGNWRPNSFWGIRASGGFTALSNMTASASTKLFIPVEGRYGVAVRTADGPDYGDIVISVDGLTNYTIQSNSSVNMLSWREVGPLELSFGYHNFSIINVGLNKTELDEIVLYSLHDDESIPLRDRIFQTSSSVEVKFVEINPSEYSVHVNSTAPFYLVFRQTYNPLWKANGDGVDVNPTIAYSFVNSFYFDRVGSFDLRIRFLGQMYFNIGSVVSVITLMMIAIFTVFSLFKRGKLTPPVLKILRR